MKCSSRRNCDIARPSAPSDSCRLNEVQFPIELRRLNLAQVLRHHPASMKCSSRRTYNDLVIVKATEDDDPQ